MLLDNQTIMYMHGIMNNENGMYIIGYINWLIDTTHHSLTAISLHEANPGIHNHYLYVYIYLKDCIYDVVKPSKHIMRCQIRRKFLDFCLSKYLCFRMRFQDVNKL